MKILLINANRLRDPIPVIPLGVCAVASAVEAAGHQTEVLDLCFSALPARSVRRAISRFRPDIVGITIRNIDTGSGYRPEFLIGEIRSEVIEPCKSVFDGPIVIGGAAAGINGPELLDYFDLPYAIQGDGEAAMIEFAARHGAGQPLSGMPGLVIRNPDGSTETNPPAFVDDLDRLPTSDPHRHLNLAPYRIYSSPLQVQTKRGCALACSYCTYNRLEGNVYRLRDPEAVAEELERAVRATGIRDVEIVDSTFNLPLDHAKAVLRSVVARNLRLRVSAMGMNPKYVDAELVELMRRSGFVEACFGIEAGSDPMLRSLGKNFTVADILRARQALRGTGIPVMWFLLLGAPGETRETIAETFRTVDRVAGPLDMVNIGVGIRVYKGAPIAGLWNQEHPGVLENFFEPLSYAPRGLGIDEIMELAAAATGTRPRYFMYGAGAHIPLPVRLVVRALFPRQPIWRFYVLSRAVAKYAGLLHLFAALSYVTRAARRRRAPVKGR
ncbi:MAG: B12-binding domain-containing radical SAM protein [Candidatus Methylomirabilia bacterium]